MKNHTGARSLVAALLMAGAVPVLASDLIDSLRFGDPVSEAAHGLTAQASTAGEGALSEPARRFLPLADNDWRGGGATFQLAVRGDVQNYLSVRMWGGDVNPNQTTLYCDGKQLGYRHASDLDILDQGTRYPVAPGRFHYVTHALPTALTSGKSHIACRLRVTGPIWRYGGTFAAFQKPMTESSRDFYTLLVHSEKMVPLDKIEGRAPASPALTFTPAQGAAVLDRVRQRVDGELGKIWNLKRPPNQLEISLLAKAYDTGWSAGHGSARSLASIVNGIDGMWELYKKDPRIAYHDKATPNEGWFGLGLIGQALRLTGPHLQQQLDGRVADGDGATITRRQALERMLVDSRQWNKAHRRLYTNQSMIKDLYGIWYNNEGLIAIRSQHADTRAKLLPFFYESMGLQPWTGSLNDKGEATYAAAEADAKFSVAKDYFQTTRKGLTKELGYVGGYGEVIDWMVEIYDATRPAKGMPGDSRIRNQLAWIAAARGNFRYPHWDQQGNRAMRLEAAIGWRDVYAPGDIIYAQKPSWDGSPLQAAVATADPRLLGYAQQMLADGQFFPSIEHMMEAPSLRATIGLLGVIDEYAAIQRSAPQAARLPMTAGQPDFVFADEEDGVVAIKHGADILYASLYWRANYGVSNLARVHYVTPVTDRTATVVLDREEYQPSGLYFTRPDNPHINGSRFSIAYPDDGPVWTAGERQPVARLPAGSKYLPGEDNAQAGRADYYQLTYGPYLIAMNSSRDRQFEVLLPPRVHEVRELAGNTSVPATQTTLSLAPGRTVVLYLGETL